MNVVSNVHPVTEEPAGQAGSSVTRFKERSGLAKGSLTLGKAEANFEEQQS